MNVGFIARSIAVLLLTTVLCSVLLTRASAPPTSSLNSALNGTNNGPLYLGQGAVNLQPGQTVAIYPAVTGHIFFTSVTHNLYFITGQHLRRQYTADGGSVAPAVSADGSHLLWVETHQDYSDILLSSLQYGQDGSVHPGPAQQLTQDQYPPTALQRVPAPYGYDNRYWWFGTKPAWSSDGTRITYVSDRPGFDPADPEIVAGAIWEQALTDPITNALQLSSPLAGTGGHDSPVWQPNGSNIVYANYVSSINQPNGQSTLEAVQAPTTNGNSAATASSSSSTIDLTPLGLTDEFPSFSPNGKQIAFIEDIEHTRTVLRIMPFTPPGDPNDYGRGRVLLKGTPFVTQPFWSPDGKYLGYLIGSGDSFTMAIRAVNRVGNDLHLGPEISVPQAGIVGADYRPAWGP